MKLLKLTLILFPFCLFYACKKTTDKGVQNNSLSQQSVKISYQLRSESLCSKELVATVNGIKKIIVNANESLNLNIQLQDDFNNDGALDILLENRKGCYEEGDGGWLKHEGSSYFIITYDGENFIRTKEVGKDWDGIIMEMQKDKLHFTIDTAQERTYVFSDYISCEDKEEVFILDGFTLKTIAVKTDVRVPDIKGVNYENHLAKISWSKEYVNIDYDIDNDGYEDYIRLYFKKSIKGFDDLYFQSSSLKNQAIPINKRSVKRVGVLASETNGVHDLVLDCNEVMKWNGKKYVYETVNETDNNKYRVFAKSGLIIRDQPDGVPIGKFDFGEEITIVEKTKIKKDYYDEKEERRIDGYWYKTTF